MDTGTNLGATVHYTREGQDGEQSVWGEIALVAIGRDPITDSMGGDWIDPTTDMSPRMRTAAPTNRAYGRWAM